MPNASPPSASTDHPTSSAASDDIRMSQSSSPATKPPHQAVPSTKDSPTPHPPPSSASAVDPSLANSKLASLLADALSQVESLKSSLNDARKRSAYFESLSKSLESVKSPSSNAPSEAANFKIAELEKRVYEAEVRRDQEIARRLALVDQWKALSKYLDRVEGASKDARVRMDRIADSGLGSGDGVFVTLHVPAIDDVPHEERTYYYDGSSSKSRKTRPRSDSIDTYPPPPKRSRVDKHGTYQQYAIDPAHFEADRAHLPHHMYIPSAITTISPNSPYATHPPPPPTGNQHHSSRPSPSHTSASQIPSSQHVVHHHQPVSHPQQIQTISSSNSVPAVSQSNHSTHSRSQSHINHSSRTHRLSSPSHNRSRSRSRSGSSLEEMLIQATTGDSPQAQVSASNAYSLKPNNATSRSRSHSNMSARLVEHPSGHPPPLSSQAMFGSHSHSHPQHQHQQFSHPSHLVGSRSSLHSPISHHPPRHPSDSPPISRRERDHSEGRGTLVPDGSLDHIQARSHVHSHQHGPGMDVREIQERDRERETDHRDHLRDREGREYSQHPSQHRQYQHTFAPVQTGAPVRKSRWNASLPSVAQEGEFSSSLISISFFEFFEMSFRLRYLFDFYFYWCLEDLYCCTDAPSFFFLILVWALSKCISFRWLPSFLSETLILRFTNCKFAYLLLSFQKFHMLIKAYISLLLFVCKTTLTAFPFQFSTF
ncbi:hypothetical protein K435DRAFT_296495 [Dendrothele bispora CBS 962.96]|uniref:Uncharacterized protein n=1 Tax=Dendrothele bispora (strain CBS 962.96) TaxID=1314807 RepID=A0A4S8LJ90_DENBC|nr:hypothetical protein K435DRAFT_296495 [Dendrothele bispora CBS 962.96]